MQCLQLYITEGSSGLGAVRLSGAFSATQDLSSSARFYNLLVPPGPGHPSKLVNPGRPSPVPPHRAGRPTPFAKSAGC